MPCLCDDYDDPTIIKQQLQLIREYVTFIVRVTKSIESKGIILQENGTPYKRITLESIHQLLDDLYYGKCQEKEIEAAKNKVNE